MMSNQSGQTVHRSAAVVFSRLFSVPPRNQPQKICRSPTHATGASIKDLPVELMVLVFKFVFLHNNRPPLPFSTTRTNGQDLLSPSLFPFALALVCPKWRDILITIPIAWSRIPIIVDTNPTPLNAIQSYLEWSRDLTLDVSVFRKPGTFDEEDPDENARVAAVVDLLTPHLHRCRTLQFDVIYNSSIPTPGQKIRGLAAKLETLALVCRQDDGCDEWIQLTEYDFSCPNIQTLAIDARNFRRSCIWHISDFRDASSVEISHFSPSEDGVDVLPLAEVLSALDKFTELHSLTLRNVEFKLDNSGLLPLFGLRASSMTFEEISDEAISDILDLTDSSPDSITLIRCPLGSIAWMSSSELTLSDISPDEDLAKFLEVWDGKDLCIRRCFSFDDVILASTNKVMYPAPNMEQLNISDCPHFSVAGLKEMVDMRRVASLKYGDDPDKTVFRIKQIIVSGCGPLISPEMAQWFHDRVIFEWRTWSLDGRMCFDGFTIGLGAQEED